MPRTAFPRLQRRARNSAGKQGGGRKKMKEPRGDLIAAPGDVSYVGNRVVGERQKCADARLREPHAARSATPVATISLPTIIFIHLAARLPSRLLMLCGIACRPIHALRGSHFDTRHKLCRCAAHVTRRPHVEIYFLPPGRSRENRSLARFTGYR